MTSLADLDAVDSLARAKIVEYEGCWVWTGYRLPGGYGRLFRQGSAQLAHYVYGLFAPIPEGLDLDHLCRMRQCVNPAHLEPVAHRVNVARGDMKRPQNRKTHCLRGHLLSETGRWYMQKGHIRVRQCAACWPIRKAERRLVA